MKVIATTTQEFKQIDITFTLTNEREARDIYNALEESENLRDLFIFSICISEDQARDIKREIIKQL